MTLFKIDWFIRNVNHLNLDYLQTRVLIKTAICYLNIKGT